MIQETERELLAKAHPDEYRTTSSGWAHNVVFYANDLQETARDKEDAVNLINKSYDSFVNRFQNPDPALGDSIEKSSEGKSKFVESDRLGSKADFISIAENATKLAEIIKEVAGKHGVEEASIKPKIDELERISKSSTERAQK